MNSLNELRQIQYQIRKHRTFCKSSCNSFSTLTLNLEISKFKQRNNKTILSAIIANEIASYLMDYYVRTKHVSRSGKLLIALPIAIAPSSEIELTLKNGVKMIQINKMTKNDNMNSKTTARTYLRQSRRYLIFEQPLIEFITLLMP